MAGERERKEFPQCQALHGGAVRRHAATGSGSKCPVEGRDKKRRAGTGYYGGSVVSGLLRPHQVLQPSGLKFHLAVFCCSEAARCGTQESGTGRELEKPTESEAGGALRRGGVWTSASVPQSALLPEAPALRRLGEDPGARPHPAVRALQRSGARSHPAVCAPKAAERASHPVVRAPQHSGARPPASGARPHPVLRCALALCKRRSRPLRVQGACCP
ncbi:unnamed protein product [Rangifer tarandus platyrhynchus]|uniref:Uncharacterized protein n=2 Tax=Rangifer tarandus platyrhynchus TaxID=3082113 RepID=A0ACB0DXM5_RANTA|nr:unnamed protein product [Rangifer tarandus platyrhynchus]CAI9693077.1 unnamed protein product [Rangifer tarandus platyrhynchus]